MSHSSAYCSCRFGAAALPFLLIWAARAAGGQNDLSDRFELPPGFHIYRAAGAELSGGSYALTFDGEGRLLVGDGNAVRRLTDKDGDGVFDSFEMIATGLGWRGPQGLLVYGDQLYAVGGDGIQVFEGYRSGRELVPKGRIGNKFNTGGDHDAHTIFRGHDGYLYFMAGNGAGIEERKHITEETSPVLFEREASVFRISPDGTKWECLAAGGRNPPNLGMNYLGDLFSFDSDMEWHVGLPWYRPVRLNHWAIGGDQGWQEVGAYPPYSIDCLPGILDVGRGSPNWGVFYEHYQLPEKYRDAYIVCDYRWKKESNDQYATTGRLVVFFLKRAGAGWKASLETLARPIPGARDSDGKPIIFALVDVAVAPDGSLFVTDHNQGIWRIIYNGAKHLPERLAIEPTWPAPFRSESPIEFMLALPQPASERSRSKEESLRAALVGNNADALLEKVARDQHRAVPQRLRAIRLVSPGFNTLRHDFIQHLARDRSGEIRGQAAWLIGLRMRQQEMPLLLNLFSDQDPFVRRRAAEALTRFTSPAAVPALVDRLGDPDRLVRSVAMSALAHYPTEQWFDRARIKSEPQIRMRALVASLIRRDAPADKDVHRALQSLLEGPTSVVRSTSLALDTPGAPNRSRPDESRSVPLKQSHLDLLRVLALYQKPIEGDPDLKRQAIEAFLKGFPNSDRDLRWEQVRLLGEYHVAEAFPKLLALLESERDEGTQFHIAQAISKLERGWTPDEAERLLGWMLATQRGWFAEFDAKGVEFPLFWSTVLADFARHHRDTLLRDMSRVNLASLLGGVVIDLLAESPNAKDQLITLYEKSVVPEARVKIVSALKKVPDAHVGTFLRQEYLRQNEPRMKGALLQSLAVQPADPANLPLFREGLRHPEVDVVRACAEATIGSKPALDEPLANLLVSRMAERRSFFYLMDRALVALSGRNRPGHKPEPEPGERLEESTRSTALAFWKAWYEERFGKKFEPALAAGGGERSDEELLRLILSADFQAGNAALGVKTYERLQCNSCHSAGVTPGQEGRLFGPDLAGVTRRLSRQELADSIVYPSKQVADRFKAHAVQLKDGAALTGFLTEQTADSITLADRDQVHRIPRSRIQSLEPQSISLMPERLLNALTDEEIRNLLAFLDHGIGASPASGR